MCIVLNYSDIRGNESLIGCTDSGVAHTQLASERHPVAAVNTQQLPRDPSGLLRGENTGKMLVAV